MNHDPKLTIAIPIHGAERWIPGIVEIVEQAPEWSRVVISDASRLDRTAERLMEELGDNPLVEVRQRTDHLDWIAHCNLLLDEADTDYFCWFPQDDLPISHGYFERLIEPLDRDPEVLVAVPTIYWVLGTGRIHRRPELVERSGTGLRQGRDGIEVEYREELDGRDALASVWKGVFRRSTARPMPRTGRGTASDAAWSFSMALAGRIVEVPNALYLKRVHRGSATFLSKGTEEDQFRQALLEEVEARCPDPGDRREAALSGARQLIDSSARVRAIRPGPVGKFFRRLVNDPRPYFE